MAKPTWAVVAMVDEPLPLVAAFVAHYLALGASSMSLMLDRPRPEVVAALSSIPEVRLTIGDADYWKALPNGRPDLVGTRHRYFADSAYNRAETEWLLHVDCDEYLLPDIPVPDILSNIPDDRIVVRFPALERVHSAEGLARASSIFSGIFKRPQELTEETRERVWGDLAPLFADTGFLGHSIGKSMVRTNRPVRMAAHFPVPTGLAGGLQERLGWLEQNEVVNASPLLHFDGLTPLHWLLKLLGKVYREGKLDPPPQAGKTIREARMNQVRAVYSAVGDARALNELARRALSLDARQQEFLGRDAGIADFPLTLEKAARKRFPALDLDFSVAAFDADLRRHRQELLRQAGLIA